MSDLEITNTRIPLLDSLLGGGFLSNSIIVVSNQPGSKMRRLGFRLVINGFKEKFHLINVTFHYPLQETINWVKVSMTKPELYKKFVELGSVANMTLIDCFNISNPEKAQERDNVFYVSNPFNVDELLSVMAQVRESIPEEKKVYWFFHNLTDMSIGVPEDELVKFCRRAFRYHKQRGDLAIYTLNEKAHSDTFFAKVYQLSDVFIKLFVEETSWGLNNGIQVIKSVFPFESKKTLCDIDENGEIQALDNKIGSKPQTQAKSLTAINYSESGKGEKESIIRTGIPRLDSLLGGGLLPNSIMSASYQYGVRVLEPFHQIFQNQFEKAHVIMINYHFSPYEIEPRLKIFEQLSEIHKGPATSLSRGNVSFIDCFNMLESETDTQRDNIYSLSNPFDADILLSAMTNVRSSIPEDKPVLWIFTSLTDMSIGVPEAELLKFCRRAFRYHKLCGDLAVYLLAEQAHSEIFRAKLYQMSDVFVKLIGENKPEGIDTSLQVLKGVFNFSSKKAKYKLDEKSRIQFLED
jgi:KaiC/GvpD/RAD55 family RecA-like ATPase